MSVRIPVLRDITAPNTALAGELRARFAQRNVLVLDIIASPGAGKTTLLEKTIAALAAELRLQVIEGDPNTSIDAERIADAGAAAVQINTGSGCHLDAGMVDAALRELDPEADVILIENVGNLLCPTGWDLGEDAKVVVASLPEGDDKPLKYPLAFSGAQVVIINKIDLEPYVPARVARLRANALTINPALQVFEVSCQTGAGLEAWYDWLRARRAAKLAGAPHAG